ncbi:hypothetical protein [Bradyrhizobium sp. Gha]|uniref:hypothetical protein n=1 Tax=Bradyrhizobium sp. Gha TaxID=1855318 RepID=UPI0008E64FD2|nr:hypothetical protein [Bradyrhizobium sp. Gha]SFK21563.1 hypothetical protein SAMN05216525_16424 [Bradyrhizobium sp. Gha]
MARRLLGVQGGKLGLVLGQSGSDSCRHLLVRKSRINSLKAGDFLSKLAALVAHDGAAAVSTDDVISLKTICSKTGFFKGFQTTAVGTGQRRHKLD